MEASPRPGEHAGPLEPVLFEVKRAIVGQDVLLERMAVALLSGGHLLVEGVPGLAKTLAVKSLAAAIGGQFQRVQFTPDLVPADLVGTRVYHQRTGEFATHLGPVFANLLLADEINRAPAKVQSALLEVMQEHQVTIGRETFRVPEPFLVMATQNPIESEGTYPLPEAQVDRFMMKVVVGYPSPAEEHAIVDRSLRPAEPIRAMLTPQELTAMQQRVLQVYVDPAVVEYAVRLVAATRDLDAAGLAELDGYVSYGASPRASIALVAGGRSLAFLRGRHYVLPRDLEEIALDVLRHRIVLSYEALADDVTADAVIARVLGAVAAPEVALSGSRPPGQALAGGTGGSPVRASRQALPGSPGTLSPGREPRGR
jgi:MoxR-like ATPase